MFCPNCGARNSEADTHCQKCGFNLKEATGAKFKGTMLMMNDAPGPAPGPGVTSPQRPAPGGGSASSAHTMPQRGVSPERGTSPEPRPNPAPGHSLSPDEAKRMRAKLKGTMIGVAPPGVGTFKPARSAPDPTPPAPAIEPPRPRQPAPGFATPGFGARGGGTMIGTGIGPTGFSNRTPMAPGPAVPGPTAPGPTLPGPTAAGPTVPGPTLPGPSANSTLESPRNNAFSAGGSDVGGPGTVRSQPGVSGVPGSGPTVQGDQVSALGGTRVMGQFGSQQPPSPVNPLAGTMVTGSPNSGPTTDSMAHAQPQFAPNAGVRTGTPPMGIPGTASSPAEATWNQTMPQGATPLSQDSDLDQYIKPESKLMVVLLTVVTGGLYWVYRRFKHPPRNPR